jgi:hypothetical protein
MTASKSMMTFPAEKPSGRRRVNSRKKVKYRGREDPRQGRVRHLTTARKNRLSESVFQGMEKMKSGPVMVLV